MSVSLTEDAVRERRKTVTRRLGWLHLNPGDRVTLCRKVMGRSRAVWNGTERTVITEPLVRICDVEIVDVRRERLSAITDEDVAREGFHVVPALIGSGEAAESFIEFFTTAMRCHRDDEVTRIEWRYLDPPVHDHEWVSDGMTTRAGSTLLACTQSGCDEIRYRIEPTPTKG